MIEPETLHKAAKRVQIPLYCALLPLTVEDLIDTGDPAEQMAIVGEKLGQ